MVCIFNRRREGVVQRKGLEGAEEEEATRNSLQGSADVEFQAIIPFNGWAVLASRNVITKCLFYTI